TPMSDHACTAAISTRSQEANLFSSDQMRAISGREYRGITVYPTPPQGERTTGLLLLARKSGSAHQLHVSLPRFQHASSVARRSGRHGRAQDLDERGDVVPGGGGTTREQ